MIFAAISMVRGMRPQFSTDFKFSHNIFITHCFANLFLVMVVSYSMAFVRVCVWILFVCCQCLASENHANSHTNNWAVLVSHIPW